MALITHWLIQTLIVGKALLQWHYENQEKEQSTHANSQRPLKIDADKEQATESCSEKQTLTFR